VSNSPLLTRGSEYENIWESCTCEERNLLTHTLISFTHPLRVPALSVMPFWSFCRSQWPSGLRYVMSSLARRPGSLVRIPYKAWMFGMYICLSCACVVLCLGSGLATSWSLVQGVLPSVKWSKWKTTSTPWGIRGTDYASKLKLLRIVRLTSKGYA
jgi:hypothetical protein